MQTITISTANSETYSSISNFFIDYYMTEANGEFVKVYLYLVRLLSINQAITVAKIADHFNLTEKDICRAIKYWISKDVLRLNYDGKGKLCGIVLLPLSAPMSAQISDGDIDSILQTSVTEESEIAQSPVVNALTTGIVAKQAATTSASQQSVVLTVPAKPRQTRAALDSKLNDPNWENIVHEFEALFGKTISPADMQTLLYIYDTLAFDVDLFEYLIEYCVTMNKKNSRYMESVAIAWYKDGIRTKAQAKELYNLTSGIAKRVFKILGIQREIPTAVENGYFVTWNMDMRFSPEIIEEACLRGVTARPNSVNFNYINGILENWHKNGVKTMADIERLDKEFYANQKKSSRSNMQVLKGGVNTFAQTSLDTQLDEMEQLLLQEVNQS
ncbi:MAG: DnaD domain protein [Lachnospiraceae bacterium]|nr:DnaD domain protein [Lachnospiraceae bacterium]